MFASNAFAILGLRALYFLLADVHARFSYLQQGLAIILAFVGVKMIIAEWYHIPTVGLADWSSLSCSPRRSGSRSRRPGSREQEEIAGAAFGGDEVDGRVDCVPCPHRTVPGPPQ